MKYNRGIRNIIWGLFYQLVVLTFGLITPRLLIVSYGSEVNGLLAAVNQSYAYFALLEAGVGMATLQALYRTIATGNKHNTNGVLVATNNFYRKTGLFYLCGIFILAVIFPFTIKTNISNVTIVAVVLLIGIPSVINYFFQGKYRLLLQAEGKSYVLSNLSTATYLVSNIIKIVLIYYGFGVIFVQSIFFVVTLLPLIYISLYIKKYYSWIDLSIEPDYQSIAQKNSVLVHQLSNLLFSNVDVLLLTFFVGLKTVSVYTLYAGLYFAVKSILFCFLDGIKYKLGQLYHSDRDKFMQAFDLFETFYMALTFAIYSAFQVMIISFMKIYTKGISDINYVDPHVALLFTGITLLQGGRGTSALSIDIAGHFRQTQWRSVAESAIKLVVSLLFIHKFGIYGVLFGSIAALLYRVNDIIIYTNIKIFNRSPWKTYKCWIFNIITAVFFILIMKNIAPSVSGMFNWFMVSACVGIASLILWGSVFIFSNRNMMKNIKSLVIVSY